MPRESRSAILVLSDGAGSASQAETGAQLACDTFARLVAEYISAGAAGSRASAAISVERWVTGVIYRLALTPSRGTTSGSRATMPAPCWPRSVGEQGDGVRADRRRRHRHLRRLDDDVAPRLLAAAWRVRQHHQLHHVRGRTRSHGIPCDPRSIAEIALFSDGLENLLLHKADQVGPCAVLRQHVSLGPALDSRGEDPELSRALAMYLSTAAVNERTNDDKTLILASRR